MSTRDTAAAMSAVLGGFLLLVSRAISPAVVARADFGVGIDIIVITVLAQLDAGRGWAQKVLDGATAVLSATMTAFVVRASGRAVTAFRQPAMQHHPRAA